MYASIFKAKINAILTHNLYMGVKERLIEYLNKKGINKSEFGRAIGVSNAYVTSIRKSIDPDKVKAIALKYPDLNIKWLLYGEGKMLNESTTSTTFNEDKVTTVPLLPISAQGGTLNDFVMAVKEIDCEKIISPIGHADFAITVSGDSMAPEYPSGSQVLIKKINERAFIDWGRTYVLDTCNGTVIKKLMPSDSGDSNIVKCVSINPAYPPFEVNLHDVYGIYRVMLCMSIK